MRTYTINESAARLSHEMRSFDDYEKGSATAGYNADVAEAAAILNGSKPCAAPRPRRNTPSICLTATPGRWPRPSTETTRSAPAAPA